MRGITAPEIPFSIASYRITAELQEDFRLPDFAGSLLRGVYGRALRRISCMTGEKECRDCPLLATCPFPELFDPPAPDPAAGHVTPAPYVIRPPRWGARPIKAGESLIFDMRLFGRATGRLPFVIQAWRQALGRGIGRGENRARALIDHVDHLESGQTIFTAEEGQIIAHDAAPPHLPPETVARDVALTFHTPFRSQVQGRPLSPEALTPRRLIADIIRRARLLSVAQNGTPCGVDWPVERWLEAADNITHDKDLTWQDWRRYSNRQHKTMTLGGVMGVWRWRQVPPDLITLLHMGEILHVGKQTVFGFGRMSCI
ncbi:CRISPR system precrRNA processing endoribonuclease RAMP protein Cas6 [Luteithermobacter gelatinilyticus]|uniref:CRISPR system precrRNA processing endoribonuclease RAMP protein Cas6 n=1 Tax=Luteithermobacter gelatinilyticus TaxID=2582913 RepID=UPI0011066781|nr:CRISPR system precrRNA processing endoribonuclease RAMP protein Cas6 [Luteithermobacter gelatinilyticus]